MFSGNWERPNGPVIIEGASWTGRTALLGAAQRLAVESGLTVLNARGNDLERGTPWGLVRQLFYSQLPWLVAETDGSAEAHGAAALDELADPQFRHLEDSLFRLSLARPVLVAVDDAHLADPESGQWLFHLARRLAPERPHGPHFRATQARRPDGY